MLYEQILCTTVLSYVHQSQNVTRKAAKKDFRTKNSLVDEIDTLSTVKVKLGYNKEIFRSQLNVYYVN